MKKLALITGATSGLGLSYAAYFASQGYDLIVTGRRREALFSNGKKWREQYHVNVETILVELSDREEVRRLIEHVGDREIDMLVNNAGFGLKPVFADTSEEEMERILSLQVWCVTKLTHFVLQRMFPQCTLFFDKTLYFKFHRGAAPGTRRDRDPGAGCLPWFYRLPFPCSRIFKEYYGKKESPVRRNKSSSPVKNPDRAAAFVALGRPGMGCPKGLLPISTGTTGSNS